MTADFSAGGKRRTLMMLALVVFACLGIVISIVKGSVDIPVGEVLPLLTGTESSPQGQIIYNIRLPRTLVAVLVGVNLALAGAILQAVMKNPLADPHIIGISAGAGLLGLLRRRGAVRVEEVDALRGDARGGVAGAVAPGPL
ncbi:MAG: iron chelate uptake ABC transporter family permease subunit, partial [Selenomonas sp.]|nr:iron chelate uptake ABC transporter family permease subunit [Selenomonas sp.]